MNNIYSFEPDYAITPGTTLQEAMDAASITQSELAERTSLSVKTLAQILSGKRPITFEIAKKLGHATDYPASFWINLESQYREQLANVNR